MTWQVGNEPCPCGHWGDAVDRCTCDPGQVLRYRGRVSGPLLDRIDLHVPVPSVPVEALTGMPPGEGSAAVRERVVRARTVQRRRFRRVIRLLQRSLDRLGLSARPYHRILKLARTIADLAGTDEIAEPHVAEAIQYRTLDRKVVV